MKRRHNSKSIKKFISKTTRENSHLRKNRAAVFDNLSTGFDSGKKVKLSTPDYNFEIIKPFQHRFSRVVNPLNKIPRWDLKFKNVGNSLCESRRARRRALFKLGLAGKIKVKYALWKFVSHISCR